MHLLKHSALFLLLLNLTVAAQARDVVILADLEHGLALLPEGTAIPKGVTVYARVVRHEPKVPRAEGVAPVAVAERQEPLVFAFAPESRFTAARKTIADAPAFRAQSDDSDVTYYVNFVDGSYVAARRIVIGTTQFGAASSVYTPAGDYYSGTLSVYQTSNDQTSYNDNANMYINSSGGLVSTNIHYIVTGDPYFSAHITTTGHIGHHYLPICGHYGEPPCNESYDGTIYITFP
jgi:hypothetical protein